MVHRNQPLSVCLSSHRLTLRPPIEIDLQDGSIGRGHMELGLFSFDSANDFGQLRVADVDTRFAPGEIRAALEKQLREGVKERKSGVALDEEELTALVNFEEDRSLVRSDDKVEAAEDETEPLEQRAALQRQLRRHRTGLDAKLMIGASPVKTARLGLL